MEDTATGILDLWVRRIMEDCDRHEQLQRDLLYIGPAACYLLTGII